jgi:hypothetical protein
MRCERLTSNFHRCQRQATHEYLRDDGRGARWRRVCPQCLNAIRGASRRLRVRPIEVSDNDEARQRFVSRHREW